jgi:hypothetical protein
MRSTRPSVSDCTNWICSGTSVPFPRTCRSISPRFTVSVQIELFSTVGAAGLNLERPTVMAASASTARNENVSRRRRFLRAISGRATSMLDLKLEI